MSKPEVSAVLISLVRCLILSVVRCRNDVTLHHHFFPLSKVQIDWTNSFRFSALKLKNEFNYPPIFTYMTSLFSVVLPGTASYGRSTESHREHLYFIKEMFASVLASMSLIC